MLCLADTDYVLKLAEFNLLDQILPMLGVVRSDVYVLPELEHVLRGDRIQSKHTRTAIQSAAKFAKGLKKLENIDPDEHDALLAARAFHHNRPIRIDGGEATLYCATKFLANHIVATGDKRSLRVLASAASCQPIHARLAGRVLCVEQTLLKLMDTHGYGFVQKRVAPACSCDDCVEQAFAGGKLAQPEADCRQWLNGFVAKLQQETKGLLYL